MYKVKILNEFFVKELLKSDKEINYENFYKDELIQMLQIFRTEYKKLQKEKRTQPTTEKFPCSNERLHYNTSRSKKQIEVSE